jgi:hypothetical protein
MNLPTKFPLGRLAATPGALQAMADSGQEPAFFLQRHVGGDWGEVDAEDRRLNDEALKDGSRLLSAFTTLKGVRLWVITEADRSLCLPATCGPRRADVLSALARCTTHWKPSWWAFLQRVTGEWMSPPSSASITPGSPASSKASVRNRRLRRMRSMFKDTSPPTSCGRLDTAVSCLTGDDDDMPEIAGGHFSILGKGSRLKKSSGSRRLERTVLR